MLCSLPTMQPVFAWAKTADSSGVLLKDVRRLSMKVLKLDGSYYNDPHGKAWTDICLKLGDGYAVKRLKIDIVSQMPAHGNGKFDEKG